MVAEVARCCAALGPSHLDRSPGGAASSSRLSGRPGLVCFEGVPASLCPAALLSGGQPRSATKACGSASSDPSMRIANLA